MEQSKKWEHEPKGLNEKDKNPKVGKKGGTITVFVRQVQGGQNKMDSDEDCSSIFKQ